MLNWIEDKNPSEPKHYAVKMEAGRPFLGVRFYVSLEYWNGEEWLHGNDGDEVVGWANFDPETGESFND